MNYDFTEAEIEDANIKPEAKWINIGSILDRVDDLDFNAPYQREAVWKKSYKIDLVKSIFDGTPIGAIHFVLKKQGSKFKWVLDGKQRLLAFMSLKNGELPLRIKDKNGKLQIVDWKKICDPNSKWNYLYDLIYDYQVQFVTWPPCSFAEQKIIFQRINNSIALTTWERMYGENFIVKELLRYIYENDFVDKTFFNRSLGNNYRNSGIKLAHSLMYLCYGSNFYDQYANRGLSAKALKNSCSILEKQLSEKEINANTEFNNETIKLIAMEKQVNCLRLASKWFEDGIRFKNSFLSSKKFEAIFVLDIVAFFIKKQQDNVLTNSYVEQNPEKIYQFILDWFKQKNSTKIDFKCRSTQISNIKKRFETMEEIFVNCEFDLKEKNQKLTRNEKVLASLTSMNYCPITNVALTDDNAVFDHVSPKAASGDLEIGVLSKSANRRKNDQTSETINLTKEYIDNYLKEEIL